MKNTAFIIIGLFILFILIFGCVGDDYIRTPKVIDKEDLGIFRDNVVGYELAYPKDLVIVTYPQENALVSTLYSIDKLVENPINYSQPYSIKVFIAKSNSNEIDKKIENLINFTKQGLRVENEEKNKKIGNLIGDFFNAELIIDATLENGNKFEYTIYIFKYAEKNLYGQIQLVKNSEDYKNNPEYFENLENKFVQIIQSIK